VAFLGHKVSAQVDAKEFLTTLTPVLQEIYIKAIQQAESRAKATSTPIDDMAVSAVKSVTSPYITPQSTGTISVSSETPNINITASS
jgi:hypothetical protein